MKIMIKSFKLLVETLLLAKHSSRIFNAAAEAFVSHFAFWAAPVKRKVMKILENCHIFSKIAPNNVKVDEISIQLGHDGKYFSKYMITIIFSKYQENSNIFLRKF